MVDVVVDTSALLAYFDESEPDHAAVVEVLGAAGGLLVVSPYVLAELDYLVATRHGVDAVLDELGGGAWELAAFDTNDLARARSVVGKYRDQNVRVADASNVVLAERYRTRTIVTLDRRHFGVLRPTGGSAFTLLPEPT